MPAHAEHEQNAILQSPLFRLETVFSRVSDNLFFASEKAAQLRGSMGNLVALSNASELEKAEQGHQAVVDFAGKLDKRIAQSSVFFNEIGKKRLVMNAEIKDLAQNIHSAGIVSLNARIIAQGHRALKQGEQLVRLAENISGITDSAAKQVADMLDATETITKSLEKLSAYAENQSLSLADHLKPEISALIKALETMIASLSAAQKGAKWMNDYFQKLETEVIKVVQGLQVGDRARQRAEHIQQILHEANSFRPGSDEGALLNQLADAQMAQAVEETLRDAEKAQKTLSELATELDRYQSYSTDLRRAFANRHELAAGILESERLNQQKREMTSGNAETQALVADIHSSDSNLQEYSVNLNNAAFQMQLASLNTIIACAREGRSAADMIVISQQVNAVVSTVPEIFVGFSAALESTKSHLNDYLVTSDEEGSDEPDQLEIIASIPQVVSVINDLMPKLASDAEQVARAIDTSDRMLGDLLNDLHASQRKSRSQSARKPRAEDLEPRLQRVSDRIRKLYTMPAERVLHDQLMDPYLETPSGAKEEAAEEKPNAGDVDLFDAAPAAAAPAEAGDDLSDILF